MSLLLGCQGMQPTGMQPNGFSPAGGCLSAPRASVISKGVFGKWAHGTRDGEDADDGDTTTMESMQRFDAARGKPVAKESPTEQRPLGHENAQPASKDLLH
jgi:hypothetical protein